MVNRIFILGMLSVSSSFAAHGSDTDKWYSDRQRGWFWHETKPKLPMPEKNKEAVVIKSDTSKQNHTADKIALNVAWLKDNLPKIQERAINLPTKENLAAFAYAQRLMIDLGSRFSTKMTEFMELETQLDESSRRPETAFALSSFNSETRDTITSLIHKITKDSHLWFFYVSNCPYCHKQIPILKELKIRYGVNILAVSMDGGLIQGIEDFEVVFDQNMTVSKKFNVSSTPSMFIVGNTDKQVIPLTQGLHALPEIEDRMLLIAREKGVISQEEYALSKSVREINVFKNSNGDILADKLRVESDPGYLADLLRARLQNINHFGATEIAIPKKGPVKDEYEN